jgi:hypothetical protein
LGFPTVENSALIDEVIKTGLAKFQKPDQVVAKHAPGKTPDNLLSYSLGTLSHT